MANQGQRSGGRQAAPLVQAGTITANVGIGPAQMSDAERDQRRQAQATVQDEAITKAAEQIKSDAEQREQSLKTLADEQGKFVLSQSELDEQIAKAVEERMKAADAAALAAPQTIQVPSPAAASQAVMQERAALGFPTFAQAGVMPAFTLPADSAQEVRRSISSADRVTGTITEIYEGGSHVGFVMPSGPRIVDVETEQPAE